MNNLSQLIVKNKVVAITIGGLIVLIGGIFYFSGNNNSPYEFITLERGTLEQEVNVTGRVKPAEDVSLAFEKGGKIAKIYVDVGDNVAIGQKLANLENSDIAAQLAQANAGVESAKAALLQYQATLEREKVKLEELKAGTRDEEIKILEAKVESAKKSFSDASINLDNVEIKADTDLANLYDDIKDILNDAYAKAEDAANKQTDELFNDDLTNSPSLSFQTSDNQAKTDAEYKRLQTTSELKILKFDIDNFPSGQDDLDSLLIKSKDSLSVVRDFLIRTNDALNGAINLANVSIYKTNVATGRANINTAISNITTQQQLIASQKNTNQSNISNAQSQMNSAQNALAVAEAELNLKKAGATTQQIAAQEAQVGQAEANVAAGQAQVRQAQANVTNYKAQLEKTILYAPIDGVVTKQNAKVGEIIAQNNAIISIISKNQYEIETNIPEADIAKIRIANSAIINLDAYPDLFFDAKVTSIDPAETIIEGVATYKVTLQFVNEDGKIKSGMTANIDILSEKKENVLSAPQRAIISKNGGKYVRLLKDDDDVKDVEVATGIRGRNGYIEIIDGANEGDRVITQVK